METTIWILSLINKLLEEFPYDSIVSHVFSVLSCKGKGRDICQEKGIFSLEASPEGLEHDKLQSFMQWNLLSYSIIILSDCHYFHLFSEVETQHALK